MTTTTTTKKATTTRRPAVTKIRTEAQQVILKALAVMAGEERKIGTALRQVRGTFGTDTKGTEAFLRWADIHVGLKKAMVYRYMQAAEVLEKAPAMEAITTKATALAPLNRLSADTLAKVAKKAKKGATAEDLLAIAATVDKAEADRQKAKAEAKAEAEGLSKAEAEKALADVTRKALPMVRKALEADATKALRQDRDDLFLVAGAIIATRLNHPLAGKAVQEAVAKIRREQVLALAKRESQVPAKKATK